MSVFGLVTRSSWLFAMACKHIAATMFANILHDCYRHLWRDVRRTLDMNTGITGSQWILAVLESSLVRMVSECGRAVGIMQRGEVMMLGKRFDWFAGRVEGPKTEERRNSLERLALHLAIAITIIIVA